MEHEPWIGGNYDSQPDDSKLLIVGFSHYGRYEPEDGPPIDDHPDFTRNVFRRWVFARELPFFNVIPTYFGEDHDAFWNRVAFANTLPTTVGDEQNKFSSGTPEQREAASSRALRLVDELKPARIFVFSRKGWNPLWPNYTGSLRDGTVRLEGVGDVDCGTYAHADGEAIAFGLRHPLFAPTSQMKMLVQAAMAYQHRQ